jgi:hypothetical protein
MAREKKRRFFIRKLVFYVGNKKESPKTEKIVGKIMRSKQEKHRLF